MKPEEKIDEIFNFILKLYGAKFEIFSMACDNSLLFPARDNKGIDTRKIESSRFLSVDVRFKGEVEHEFSIEKKYGFCVYRPDNKEVLVYGGPFPDFSLHFPHFDAGPHFRPRLPKKKLKDLIAIDDAVDSHLAGIGSRVSENRYLIRV